LLSPDRAEARLSGLMAAIYAIIGVQLPFFTLWLAARGLSAREIAAVMAAAPLIRIVSTLVASREGDRHGAHGAILVGCLAAVTAAFAVMGALHGFWSIFAAVALLAAAQGPTGVLADGIILAEARRRQERATKALDYAAVRGWGSASILFFMLIAGPIAAIVANDDLVWLHMVVAGLATAAAFGALRGFEGPAAGGRMAQGAPREALTMIGLTIAATVLIQCSHGFVNAFGPLLWKASGHDENFVALAWAAALVTEIGFFFAAGRWLGGARNAFLFLVLGGIAATLRWLWMASDPGTLGLYAAQALHGVSCAAVQLGPAYLLAELFGRERIAQSQGWLAAGNAAGSALAVYASGPLYESFGVRGYLGMAALSAAGLALTAVIALRRPSPHRRVRSP